MWMIQFGVGVVCLVVGGWCFVLVCVFLCCLFSATLCYVAVCLVYFTGYFVSCGWVLSVVCVLEMGVCSDGVAVGCGVGGVLFW